MTDNDNRVQRCKDVTKELFDGIRAHVNDLLDKGDGEHMAMAMILMHGIHGGYQQACDTIATTVLTAQRKAGALPQA